MPYATGLAGQLMLKKEVTHGTRIAPDRTFEFVGVPLKHHVNKITSKGQRVGRVFKHRVTRGIEWVDGPLKFEFAPQGGGILLELACGNVATTGAGPYTHTITRTSALDGISATVQTVVPEFGGTGDVYDFVGCQVAKWKLSQQVDKFLMLDLDIYGASQQAINTNAAATPSYPAGYLPFQFDNCALTLAGAATDFISIEFEGDNGLATGIHRHSATTPRIPRRSRSQSRADYGGTIVLDYENVTNYNKAIAATDVALVCTWTSGATTLTISGNVKFDTDTPAVDDPEKLTELRLPFSFDHATADASAFTMVLVNSDATA